MPYSFHCLIYALKVPLADCVTDVSVESRRVTEKLPSSVGLPLCVSCLVIEKINGFLYSQYCFALLLMVNVLLV